MTGIGTLRSALAAPAALLLALLAGVPGAEAQQARAYRVGVVMHGGTYARAIDGLRDGLREAGLVEGKQVIFHVRDAKGNPAAAESAAKSLEQEKVDLIFSLSTSVTREVVRATKSVPIVFYAGTDPVAQGLIASYRKPGGRLTGVHTRFTELTSKRMQLLKEMMPNTRRVIALYNPGNTAAKESIRLTRESARQLKVEVIERHTASVDELRAAARAIRPGEADALFYIADAMVNSQAEALIEAANAIKLATMFADTDTVAKGALAGYGLSYYAFGRTAARIVLRILKGADPATIPVEQLDTPRLAVNLKTARLLGVRIPDVVMARADEIIE